MEEIWKSISDYENYQISNLGNIKSLNYHNMKIEKLLKPTIGKRGYMYINLINNNQHKRFYIHKLVAMAFCDINNIKRVDANDNSKIQVNHINENKLDNRACNLEWCTLKYNINYGTRLNRMVETNKNNGNIDKFVQYAKQNFSKKVYQYDINYNLLNIWDSTKEIERKLGYDSSQIASVCRGNHKTAKGYIWSYKPLDRLVIEYDD